VVTKLNNQLKEQVLRYVVEHPGATDDEIAEKLNMHIIDVVSALLLLEEEGKVKSIEEDSKLQDA